MEGESRYSCFLLIEITLVIMFIFGFVFMFNIDTELMGFMMVAFTHFIFFVVVTYKVLNARKEDLIAFAIFASLGLSFAALVMSLFFLYNSNMSMVITSEKDALKGLPRDIITVFESIYITVFVFFIILYAYYLYNQDKVKITNLPFITSAIFAVYRGAELTNENIYALVATPLCILLLALTSYNVYVTSFLSKIVLLN